MLQDACFRSANANLLAVLPSLLLCHGMQQLRALGDTVGVVSRGAAQHVVEGLHKMSYAQHQPDHEKDSCTEQ